MVHNTDIADIFDEIADLLEVEDSNPFRIRAYRNAALSMRDLNREAADMVANNENLCDISGIGEDLAAKIKEILKTGTAHKLIELRKKTPHAVTNLLKIPGLGPKRIKILYEKLHIHTVNQLREAAKKGKIRTIPGFGEKTEQEILGGIKDQAVMTMRHKWADVMPYVESLVQFLKSIPGVSKVEVCGSYRRLAETVGDIDILVVAKKGSEVTNRFIHAKDVTQIIEQGNTRARVILRKKLPVDIRIVPPQSFGAAVHYFSGSRTHVIQIRDIAEKKNLKINEYGVFKGSKSIASETEEDVYKTVGLPYIPPELRENRGEIEAAQHNQLPHHLITLSDLKGDLHAHTNATDGKLTLSELAEAAKARGFEYINVSDHSKRLAMARGLNVDRLESQIEAIDKLNDKLKGITLLKSIEVDILEDGQLDLPDDILKKLDLVVASVHGYFNLSRDKQTSRILKAMDNNYFTILGHASGRLIGKRKAYDVDLEKIIKHAKQRGCYLELNAHPIRLDLDDVYCKMAKELGVLIAINSDAHSDVDFNNLRFGINQARRGWLEPKDVLNTRSLKELKKLLQATRK